MLYLDNAATTPLHPKALEAMLPFFTEHFANPNSVYSPARKVRGAVDEARQALATAINAEPGEIYFTSGGTESDNWAIKGVLDSRGGHIITTKIEHHGVLYVCEHLKKQGFDVTYLPVDEDGFVHPAALEEAIRPDTRLVSIILANNEVGTIQPISELAKITQKHGIPFHTDAVQAVGHIPIDVNEMGIQMLALSAHKFHGPRGIGALYVKKGTKLAPIFQGGAQERGQRAGTENVPGIIGMGVALQACLENLPAERARITAIRDRLLIEITEAIPHAKLNGAFGDKRLPGNINISFNFIEGESLLLHLDMNGCYASTGSACSSGALEPSHVLMAMGLSHELANGAIRFSLGRNNTMDDVPKLMSILCPAVEKLRSMSPLYDDYLSTHRA